MASVDSVGLSFRGVLGGTHSSGGCQRGGDPTMMLTLPGLDQPDHDGDVNKVNDMRLYTHTTITERTPGYVDLIQNSGPPRR